MNITEVGDTFTCDCGFSWKRGFSGSHDCGDGLRRQIADLNVQILANQQVQPVAVIDRRPVSRRVVWRNDGDKLPHGTELFTAPPVPAVIILDKVSCEGFDPKDWVEARNLGQCEGWNAYRAEMLAQSVSQDCKLNSPEIPDGWIACSEQTPDTDGAYWCWFGKEEPSVIQQRVCIWINRNNEWCDSAVTHWMPLPAAPATAPDEIEPDSIDKFVAQVCGDLTTSNQQ